MSARSIVTFSTPAPLPKKRGGPGNCNFDSRGLYVTFCRPPPGADVIVTYCQPKKDSGGSGLCEADGYILQAPPLRRFSLHVLAVDQPRDAADVSMMASCLLTYHIVGPRCLPK